MRPLDRVLEAASRLLEARAYVHHYERHGIGLDEFQQRLVKAEQILFDYRQL